MGLGVLGVRRVRCACNRWLRCFQHSPRDVMSGCAAVGNLWALGPDGFAFQRCWSLFIRWGQKWTLTLVRRPTFARNVGRWILIPSRDYLCTSVASAYFCLARCTRTSLSWGVVHEGFLRVLACHWVNSTHVKSCLVLSWKRKMSDTSWDGLVGEDARLILIGIRGWH